MNEEKTPSASPGHAAKAEDLRSALSLVVDPELHMNIVDLGLVYEVTMENGLATVQMTLTTPGCPYGPYILHEVDMACKSQPGVEDVNIEVVWDPPWSPEMMSEEARLELGFDL